MENKGFMPPRPPRELQNKSEAQKEEKKIVQNQTQPASAAESFSAEQKSAETVKNEVKEENSQKIDEKTRKIDEKTQKNEQKIEKTEKTLPKFPTPPPNFKRNVKADVKAEAKENQPNLPKSEISQTTEQAKSESEPKIEAKEEKKSEFLKPESIVAASVAEASGLQIEEPEKKDVKPEKSRVKKEKGQRSNFWNWVLCGGSFVFFVVFLVLMFV